MIQLPTIAAIKSFINIKTILITIGIIIIGLSAWKVNSIFNENGKLRQDNAVQESHIDDLNNSIKYKDDLVHEIQKRIKLIETLDKERQDRVNKEKEKSKGFSSNSKSEAEKIKKETPELLDEFYANKYNDILECIQNVTEGVQSKC